MDLKEHPVHDFDTNSSEGNTHRDFLLLTGAAESDVHVKTKERCEPDPEEITEVVILFNTITALLRLI